MRNFKRVLSLALALVMVLGMMVMTTSAATFTDAEEITYQEAVDVMSAIGVIDGIEAADGTYSFDPTATLTREQGAKIVCYLLMGKTAAEKLVGSGEFTDVAATRWSAGAIDYCAALGILDGMGDGTFAPTGKLTAVQFGKMLLCALGYDADIEGYTGKNWATNIAVDMVDIGLDVYGVSLDEQLTREVAAQMALQALECSMVKYATKGTSVTIEGVDVVVGASNAEAVSYTKDSYYYSDADETLEFVEKYYPNLTKAAATDGMMRPAHMWLVKGKAVGLYVYEADHTAFVTVKENTLAKVVANISKRYNTTYADIYVNGVLTPDYTAQRGDIVELYMNGYNANLVDTIVITHKTVANMTKVSTVTTENMIYVTVGGTPIDAEYYYNVVGYENLKPFSVVMYYTDADGVYYIEAAESFAGTMTATIDANGKETITDPAAFIIAGETEYASKQTGAITEAELTALKQDTTATYWVDNAGYIIYGEGAEEEVNLLMVLKNNKWSAGNVFTGATLESQVVFVNDANTTEIINIASVDKVKGAKPVELDDDNTVDDVFTDNENLAAATLYSYTVNKDGSYNLFTVTTKVSGLSGDKIINGIPSAFGTVYTDKVVTDSTTVYLLRDKSVTSAPYADTYTAYVGYKNVPSVLVGTNGAEVYSDKGVAKYVVINDYSYIGAAAADDIYVLSSELTAQYNAQKKVEYFSVSAIVDGVKTTIKVAEDATVETIDHNTYALDETTVNPLKDHTLYIISGYTAEGYVAAMVEADSSAPTAGTYYWVGMVGSEEAKNDKIVLNTAGTKVSYAYAADAVVYTISAKGDVVSVGDITTLAEDTNDKISVVVAGSVYGTAANNTVVEIYVYKQNPTAPVKPAEPEVLSTDTQVMNFILDAANNSGYFYLTTEAGTATVDLTLDEIGAYLEANGYTNVAYDGNSEKWSFNKGYATYTNIAITQTELLLKNNTTKVTAEFGFDASGTPFLKMSANGEAATVTGVGYTLNLGATATDHVTILRVGTDRNITINPVV